MQREKEWKKEIQRFKSEWSGSKKWEGKWRGRCRMLEAEEENWERKERSKRRKITLKSCYKRRGKVKNWIWRWWRRRKKKKEKFGKREKNVAENTERKIEKKSKIKTAEVFYENKQVTRMR